MGQRPGRDYEQLRDVKDVPPRRRSNCFQPSRTNLCVLSRSPLGLGERVLRWLRKLVHLGKQDVPKRCGSKISLVNCGPIKHPSPYPLQRRSSRRTVSIPHLLTITRSSLVVRLHNLASLPARNLIHVVFPRLPPPLLRNTELSLQRLAHSGWTDFSGL